MPFMSANRPPADDVPTGHRPLSFTVKGKAVKKKAAKAKAKAAKTGG